MLVTKKIKLKIHYVDGYKINVESNVIFFVILIKKSNYLL
jgi:hypothetical protein